MRRLHFAFLAALLINTAGASARHSSPAPLQLVGTVQLPGISGDMDHLAMDAANHRILLAAEDNGTVRVVDLNTDKLTQTLRGFKTPHSLLVLPEQHKVFITDGSDSVRVYDSRTLRPVDKIRTTAGADSIGFDSDRGLLYAVTGGKDVSMETSFLTVIDVKHDKLVQELPINAVHVEAMALERSGPRLFVNVTDKNYLAVIDRNTMRVTDQWPIREAKENAPLAIDEADRRLFVICRDPGRVVVLDGKDGKTVASFPTGARADEAVFDPVKKRVYVTAGEGKVYAYQQQDMDHYVALPPVLSKRGAKTATLSPDGQRLFVSVSPGEGKTGAELLIFRVN